jgi:hypothetical protein
MHEGAHGVSQLSRIVAVSGGLRVRSCVMSAASIGSGKAAGYARYLESRTVAPERGDYYLRPDGGVTEAPGRWLSDPETLEGLGVSGAGPLEGPAFVAVMEDATPRRDDGCGVRVRTGRVGEGST